MLLKLCDLELSVGGVSIILRVGMRLTMNIRELVAWLCQQFSKFILVTISTVEVGIHT
jgi:hypothetical protein